MAKWLLFPLALLAASVAGAQDRGPVAVADHLALNVADPHVSATFYREAFGMTELPTELPNTHWLAMGSIALHLIGTNRKDKPVENRFTHLALRTDDLGRSIAWFDAKGIAWTDAFGKARTIQTRFDGVRQIFVQDPDGHWIEVSDARGAPPKH
jgi:lactoylglutathione lyase